MSTVWVGIVIISVDGLPATMKGRTTTCFTAAELDYAMGFRAPLYPLAARFCAKRAIQLWGSSEAGPLLALDEVEVLAASFAPPQVCLRGEAQRLAAAREVRAVHLSLSHCRGYAGALVAVTADREGEARCGG